MTIKTIKVKNFKSFKELRVDLGKFNILIGANASGKSNFKELFKFLRDIAREGLDNAVQLQGGPEYLTNLTIGVGEDLSIEVAYSPQMPGATHLLYKSKETGAPGGIKVLEGNYKLSFNFRGETQEVKVVEDRLTLRSEFVTTELGRFEFIDMGEISRGIGELVVSRDAGKLTVKATPPESFPLDRYELKSILGEETDWGSGLVLDLLGQRLLEFGLEGIAIYDFDPRLPKEGTLITGKAELEEDGNNLAIVLNRIIQDEDRKRKLANLLQELLPFIADVHVQKFADKSLLFNVRETYAKNQNLPASFISDGTINIFALIVALYFEEKPIAIIEEPERNVHPYLVSKIVGMMKDASERKQIIVTTHNPEVVRNADIGDILLVSRNGEGFSTISRPAENEEVKVFLQNEMGLDELFVQNLLHA